MKRKIYFECINDNVWGEAPANFAENKHFVCCPKCDGRMFLFRTENPLADGLKEKNKVELTKLIKAEKP